MNIHLTTGIRPGKPFLLSIEDKALTPEGQEFVSTQNSDFITHYDCVCTQTVWNTIAASVGTITAPALIADANAEKFAERVNVYIENGSLKIAS